MMELELTLCNLHILISTKLSRHWLTKNIHTLDTNHIFGNGLTAEFINMTTRKKLSIKAPTQWAGFRDTHKSIHLAYSYISKDQPPIHTLLKS